ncbi:MAG: WbqC family protein [Flammeovirgaceae bacterium]
MKQVLIDLHYLPNIEYFTILSKAEKVWIEAHESFQKQSFRNRTYILTANQIERLSIPVIEGNHHTPIREVRIDYSQKWQQKHWRAITSAYNKSPFFVYYADDLEKEIWKGYEFLFDLNFSLLTLCHRWLGLKCKIEFTQSYSTDKNGDFWDVRSAIHPKKATGIINVQAYPQVFSNKVKENFVSNLNILDLLSCEGNHATTILQKQSSMFIEQPKQNLSN